MRQRFIQVNGELVPASEFVAPEPTAPMVMPDIQPYRSMLDGSIIPSRSRHREHLRAHGVIEVGNEKPQPQQFKPAPGLKQEVIRQTQAYMEAQRTGRPYGRQ